MPNRREFIKNTAIVSSMAWLPKPVWGRSKAEFTSLRPDIQQRKFRSVAVDNYIEVVKKGIADPEMRWLFENCYPNTLDTTVDFEYLDGQPDTFVITGDIDAMWLRDSSAQVTPYLPLAKEDKHLREMIAGVINRQVHFIHLDPYANAFYKDTSKVSEWKESDITKMLPGVHERKWEIDSLCYPIRLSYLYWKATGDTSPFDLRWQDAIILILKTFREQQRKTDRGPYTFQRRTAWATDGVPLSGYGYPVKPVGLICSMFRPSDDATIFPFLIPSNYFAVEILRYAAEMSKTILKNEGLAHNCWLLAEEVSDALKQYSTTMHPAHGRIIGYETNAMGSYNLMDDANSPNLLSLPYLTDMELINPDYCRTRAFVLSDDNPFYFKGLAGEGLGGPHTGINTIWPMGIIMRALTSSDPQEISKCLQMLKTTHGGTGFMHESFNKDNAADFTRKWFAWANTLFGELVIKVYNHWPELLK